MKQLRLEWMLFYTAYFCHRTVRSWFVPHYKYQGVYQIQSPAGITFKIHHTSCYRCKNSIRIHKIERIDMAQKAEA